MKKVTKETKETRKTAKSEIESVAEHYTTLSNPKIGSYLTGRCPFCNSPKNPFTIDIKENTFLCLSCGASGSPEEFIARKHGVSLNYANYMIKNDIYQTMNDMDNYMASVLIKRFKGSWLGSISGFHRKFFPDFKIAKKDLKHYYCQMMRDLYRNEAYLLKNGIDFRFATLEFSLKKCKPGTPELNNHLHCCADKKGRKHEKTI